MSDVRIIRIKSRLKSLALGHGGLTAREAISRAETALEEIRDAHVESLDALIDEIDRRFGEQSGDAGVKDYEGLYDLGSKIIDISGCLPGSLIDKAAYAVCDLADLSSELGVWDKQAVGVHVMVLRLLRSGGKSMSPERRERVVQGLYKVTEKRIGSAEAVQKQQYI